VKIPTNELFLELAAAGKCGNTPRVWLSIADAVADPTMGQCFVSTRKAGHYRLYHQTRSGLRRLLSEAARNHGTLRNPLNGAETPISDTYCMSNPDVKKQSAHFVFQFDWVPEERWLLWSVSNQPWGAIKRAGTAQKASGARAMGILRYYLQEHVDELEALWDHYPTAIIEATLFPFKHGVYNRNLLIWEVRDY